MYQEVALVAIRELCHRYSELLRDTSYCYDPSMTHNDEYSNYQNENNSTMQYLVRMLSAMDNGLM